MRFYLEQSQRGGWTVRSHDAAAPISTHDTEEEAAAQREAYERGDARAAHPPETVALRDGAVVEIRAVAPSDRPLFERGFRYLGERSRRRRFMGFKKSLTDDELDFLTHVDHHAHEALAALNPHTGDGLGVTRFVSLPDEPGIAEVAIVVVDEWQGRGLGTLLLERLAGRAREEGLHAFRASLYTENRPMLSLFERLGEVRVDDREGNTLEITIELPLGETGRPELSRALKAAAQATERPRESE